MAGPFIRETVDPIAPDYVYQKWQTQKKPWLKPLPYIVRKGFSREAFGGTQVGIPGGKDCAAMNYCRGAFDPVMESDLYDRASRRVIGKLRGNGASLGVSLAEAGQSWQMIASTAGSLTKAYRALRKGDLKRCAKYLGISPTRARHATTLKKELSDKWLALHFGWAPMLGDMYDAANLLSQTPPYNPERATVVHRTVIQGRPRPVYDWVESGTVEVSFKVQGTQRITNPNLYLLERAGLANPAIILWELIPFSFLLDWMFNFGSVISSFTDTLGATYEGHITVRRTAFINAEFAAIGNPIRAAYRSGAFVQERFLWAGPSNVSPIRSAFKLPSWQRLATAASLACQQFGR